MKNVKERQQCFGEVKINYANIFLVRRGCTDPESIIKEKYFDDLEELDPKDKNIKHWIFIRSSERQVPPGIRFLLNLSQDEVTIDNSQGLSGLLILEVDSRLFVISFGYGHNFIKPEVKEPDFGYTVGVKSIDPNSVDLIDWVSLNARTFKSRRQSGRGLSFEYFGLDAMRDQVRTVAGKPMAENFGKKICGGSSLIIHDNINLSVLIAHCRRALNIYNEPDLKEFWINPITEIKDPILTAQLDSVLIEKMRRGDSDGILVSPPDLYDPEVIAGFCFSNQDHEITPALDLEVYIKSLENKESLSKARLTDDYVKVKDAQSGAFFDRWRIWDCLECEITFMENTYILFEGRWSSLPEDNVKLVNMKMDRVQAAKIKLPPAFSSETEPEYNRRVAKSNSLALMDTHLIRDAGYTSGIEFCDLFSVSKEIIHNKWCTSSQGLSHLSRQAINSAEMFTLEDSFRTKVLNILKLKGFYKEGERLHNDDFTIVLGIITPKKGEWSRILPFFSKLTILETIRKLRSMQFQVALLRINEETTSSHYQPKAEPEVGGEFLNVI